MSFKWESDFPIAPLALGNQSHSHFISVSGSPSQVLWMKFSGTSALTQRILSDKFQEKSFQAYKQLKSVTKIQVL